MSGPPSSLAAAAAPPAALAARNSCKPHVVLLGDSTIDNICWTGHPDEVPAQLKALLPPNALVTNFAADGFNSADLLKGAVPTISWVKREKVGDPFPGCGPDRIFRPLELLKTLSPKPTHAVLSIGGNDVREILGNMAALPDRLKRFQANYSEILEKLCNVVPNVVLMLQYRPAFNMDDHGYGVYQAISSIPGPGDAVAKLHHLMEAVYEPVLCAARQQRFAVLDLPRTFDIYDDELYCCQIEPSAKGGAVIAKLMSHAVQHHDFAGPSRFYLMKGGQILDEANDGRTPWSIPRDEHEVREIGAVPRSIPHDEGDVCEVPSGIDTAAYKQLCGMGFEPPQVAQALKACGNNIEAACERLTGGLGV